MNKVWWLTLLLAFSCRCGGRAAEKPSAGSRAFLYQREARVVLESRGWHVSRDANGKLVADHPLGSTGTGVGPQKLELVAKAAPANGPVRSFAWLTLTFEPETVTRTRCAANIVAYILWERTSSSKNLKPLPFNNPDSNKEIQSMMVQAEGRLTAKHPEYVGK